MFCEGTHRTKHSLLPINKGISRIALKADNELDKHVYIVPTGLEYGDYFRLKSTCVLTFGEPMDITEMVKSHPEMQEQDLHALIRKELGERMASLITYLPDDENYESSWILMKAGAGEAQVAQAPAELREKALAFERDRLDAKISSKSFGHKALWLNICLKTLGFIVGLPFFLFSAVALLPLTVTSYFINKTFKDKAWHNSVCLLTDLLLGPLTYLIWAILLFCLLPWFWALPAFILVLTSHMTYHNLLEFTRVYFSDIKLIFHKDLNEEFKSIVEGINEIK